MKILFAFGFFCALFLVLFNTWGMLAQSDNLPWEAFPAALNLPAPQTEPVRLLFVGDIMLDRGVEFAIHKNNSDWAWPFRPIAPFLTEADLVFGNLESQISSVGENVGSEYSFQADPHALKGLTFAGFDVLSVANNHSFDYTGEALEDSLSRLREAGIVPVGGGSSDSEAYHLIVQKIHGVKIGFLAYTNSGSPNWSSPDKSSIAWVDEKNMSEVLSDITKAKEYTDILIVSLHAGEEYAEEPNAFQKLFSQQAVEAGADLIVGHHPHVIQPLVPHNRADNTHGWIAYSLGNFIFDQNFSEETMRGAILEIIIENKSISKISMIPTRITPSFQVRLEE